MEICLENFYADIWPHAMRYLLSSTILAACQASHRWIDCQFQLAVCRQLRHSLRASLCKILIWSFAHKMDFAHNFSVDFFS